MMILSVYWVLLAIGLFFLALAGVVSGEASRVMLILGAASFAVDIILGILAVAG